MELQWGGGLWVFANHTCKKTKTKQNKCKTKVQDVYLSCGMLGMFIFMLRLQLMQVVYAPDVKNDYFDYGRNLKTQNDLFCK